MVCVKPGVELPAQNKGGKIISYGQESTKTQFPRNVTADTVDCWRGVSDGKALLIIFRHREIETRL